MDTDDEEVYDWFILRYGEVWESIYGATKTEAIKALVTHATETPWIRAYLVRVVDVHYPDDDEEEN